jgi:hypothetical protein
MSKPIPLFAVMALALGAAAVRGADSPTLWTAAEVQWSDVPEIPGARQAHLWGRPGADHGTLNRWRANTKLPAATREQDLHVVVLAGTFTVEIQGTYKEFGPRSFIRVPEGVTHVLGCEAAGECVFVFHQPGAAPGPR